MSTYTPYCAHSHAHTNRERERKRQESRTRTAIGLAVVDEDVEDHEEEALLPLVPYHLSVQQRRSFLRASVAAHRYSGKNRGNRETQPQKTQKRSETQPNQTKRHQRARGRTLAKISGKVGQEEVMRKKSNLRSQM
jgi:hypothetical protein